MDPAIFTPLLFANFRTAARVLDMTPSQFESLVKEGRLPQPCDIGGLEALGRRAAGEVHPQRQARSEALMRHVVDLAGRPVAYVSAETLANLLDCSSSTIREYVRTGRLPKPVKIGGENGVTRWRWEDVEAKISGCANLTDPILEASRGG